MTPLATSFEELVLLAIREGAEPTGARLQGWLSDATGKQVHIGALHTTLGRLVEKELIRKMSGESRAAVYAITAAGSKELNRAQEVRDRIIEVCI